MLGEFGAQIDSAPYDLEDIITEVFENNTADEAEARFSQKYKLNVKD